MMTNEKVYCENCFNEVLLSAMHHGDYGELSNVCEECWDNHMDESDLFYERNEDEYGARY